MSAGNMRNDVRKSRWRLYVFSFAYGLVRATQSSTMSLQTSVEVKEDRGATNVLLYSVMCVVSLFAYVPMVTLIGRKATLIAGEIPSVTFTLSFVFGHEWLVKTTAALVGIGEALMISASGAIATSITSHGGDVDGKERNSNIGIHVAMLGFLQALASITPELILKNSATTSHQWMNDTVSVANMENSNISECGSNDCPFTYAFKEQSSLYTKLIPTDSSWHLYLYVLTAAQFVGILLHVAVTPNDKVAQYDDKEIKPILRPESTKVVTDLRDSVPRLVRHITSKLRICTLLVHLQYGLFAGFLWSEFGRAYVSCTIGVQHLGLLLFLTYMVSFVTNLISNKFASRISMTTLHVFSFTAELAVYLLAYLWHPTVNSLYVPYLLAALIGIAHSFRRLAAFDVASHYFEDQDSSFLIHTGFAALGNAITFAWASALCVYIKLFILAVLSCVTTVLAVVADCRYVARSQ